MLPAALDAARARWNCPGAGLTPPALRLHPGRWRLVPDSSLLWSRWGLFMPRYESRAEIAAHIRRARNSHFSLDK